MLKNTTLIPHEDHTRAFNTNKEPGRRRFHLILATQSCTTIWSILNNQDTTTKVVVVYN